MQAFNATKTFMKSMILNPFRERCKLISLAMSIQQGKHPPVTHERYAIKHLMETHGQIVVMSSYSGDVGLPSRQSYCASKFAVNGFFESLKMEMI